MKALVCALYSLYPGLVSIVFSSRATPETRISRNVIKIGLKIVHQPPADTSDQEVPPPLGRIPEIIGMAGVPPDSARHDLAFIGRV